MLLNYSLQLNYLSRNHANIQHYPIQGIPLEKLLFQQNMCEMKSIRTSGTLWAHLWERLLQL